MQEYAGTGSNKNEYRDGSSEGGRERVGQSAESYQSSQHQYPVIARCSNKDPSDANIASYCRVASGIYEASASSQQYQNQRYNNASAPSFSSPPHSPLVGLVFDPSSPNYNGPVMSGDRNSNVERRTQNTWSSVSNQEPIGTGAKKKIVKSQDKRNVYNPEPRYQDKYKDSSTETERQKKQDRILNSESTSSLDFFAEGEKMVSELCNIESSLKSDGLQKQNSKNIQEDDKNKAPGSSDLLLTALDKIVIHDQIPNQIVQLAVEACTDAENIAIAHHNRPCFKNIHSICAKTRSNVQKPDSAVANLHSQGIPWVIKNFIFSFVRILDGWKGVKELLSEKHDTFSRIENKYYSPNIRECFVQWQAVTKEMLTHIYKTFKTLDHGFTMEQKSFTHNYYATNSAAPRHQNQNKFQPVKPQISTPKPVNSSPQTFNAIQPPWVQNQAQSSSQAFTEPPWPVRPGVTYKKFPVVPPPNTHNFYPLSDQNDVDNYQKPPYKCDPCIVREAKPRQSWTITNIPDFRALEGMCHSDQRELYSQLKHKMDAELGKAPGQPLMGNMPFDILLQRREMELKAKMIPLSHVEKTLIPSMASAADMRGCYVQKNNSCGDTKEEADFFATWGQMVQKEPNDFITHHSHNIQIPSNVVTISNNISGPVQFIDPENDEFHEISKVYMKPGSYKVPIKPADPNSSFMPGNSPQEIYENNGIDDMAVLKMKAPYSSIMLAPQPKYSLEAWPCSMSRRSDEVYDEKLIPRNHMVGLDLRAQDTLELLSSMTSDRAWEAAKQSAPKLMDFLHEGSKSDTARLYDALGLNASDEYCDELKQVKLGAEQSDLWGADLSSNHFLAKNMPNVWSQTVNKQDYILPPNKDQTFFADEVPKLIDNEMKNIEPDDQQLDTNDAKNTDSKENPRCPNFDKTGNYVRDDSQKKLNGKTKVAMSGMWYHPKKKKPLASSTVKKFESIISSLLQLKESAFIQHDMDIKMAPRFYEVVKYPMCLHDISTKLKNASYTEFDQVVQDFRRIFHNVRLYLKSYPDANMKKEVNKVSIEFEEMLPEQFENKLDSKKAHEIDNFDKQSEKENDASNDINNVRNDDHKKMDAKYSGEDKK